MIYVAYFGFFHNYLSIHTECVQIRLNRQQVFSSRRRSGNNSTIPCARVQSTSPGMHLFTQSMTIR